MLGNLSRSLAKGREFSFLFIYQFKLHLHPTLLSLAVIKHHKQKQLGEGRVYFTLQVITHH